VLAARPQPAVQAREDFHPNFAAQSRPRREPQTPASRNGAVAHDEEELGTAVRAHAGEPSAVETDYSSALSALTPPAHPGPRNPQGAPGTAAAAAHPVPRRDKDARPARQRPPGERETQRRHARAEELLEARTGRRMSVGSKLAGAAVVILAGVVGAWYFLAGPGIKAARVVRGEAVQIVYATGPVESETWARLTPLVRGRIVERCRCEGAAVKSGQRLARLDDREGQAVLKDLRAQESYLTMEFERQQQLMEKGATTAQVYQKTQIELDRIRAQVAAQIERLRYYELQAPMDGVVLKEDGEVGDMVDPGTILYQVGLPRPIWVVGEVNEEDVPRVTPGQKALLRSDAFPGQELQGFVKQITPAGDPVAKTFRVRIGLPEDTPLHIGMTAEINIVTGKKSNVLLVPASSVFDNSVLVVTDGQPVVRKVTVGIRGSSNFEITSGLREGEIVASEPNPELRAATHVRILSIETPGR